MKDKEILDILRKNNIEMFPVRSSLDVDCDVVLDSENLNDFIKFCNLINNRIAFYEILYIELDDYKVDEDEVRELTEGIISERIEESYFEYGNELKLEDFREEIHKVVEKVKTHNKKVCQKINALNEPEVFSADIYVIYNGVSVGVRLMSDYMKDYPMTNEVMDNLEVDVISLIEPKILMHIIDKDTYYAQEEERRNQKRERERQEWEEQAEREQKEWEEKRRLDIEKYENAMQEIEKNLWNDKSLMECTTKKSRHIYAKKLSRECSERYDMYITISDLEILVNDVYEIAVKQLKNNIE